jgi:hypothetical protein
LLEKEEGISFGLIYELNEVMILTTEGVIEIER